MKDVIVKIKNLSKSLALPRYETKGAAGLDVMASFDCEQSIKIYLPNNTYSEIEVNEDSILMVPPFSRALIPTGIKVAISEGYEIQVRPRSGLTLKKGVTVLNTPGTIDEDYRGMVCVILMNNGHVPFEVKHGDKIAQIVLNQVDHLAWEEVEELDETERGEGGFGSTSEK